MKPTQPATPSPSLGDLTPETYAPKTVSPDVSILNGLLHLIKVGNASGWSRSWNAATVIKAKECEGALSRLLAFSTSTQGHKVVAELEVRNGIVSLKHTLAPAEQFYDGMKLYASPTAAQCACPQHGRWLAADDIYRMVRELDVAMNGAKAANKQASLCDIFEELKEYIEAVKAGVVVPAAQGQKAVAGENLYSAFIRAFAYIAKRGHQEDCPADHEPYEYCNCGWDDIISNCALWKRLFSSPVPASGEGMKVPDGWKLVPEYVTDEMLSAGSKAGKWTEWNQRRYENEDAYGYPAEVWDAMLAAAPVQGETK